MQIQRLNYNFDCCFFDLQLVPVFASSIIKDMLSKQIQTFITNSEFNHFKRILDQDLNHLRAIIDIQQNQINLLFNQRHKTSINIQENCKKNEELQKQNNDLNQKIRKMEEEIKTYHSQTFYPNNLIPTTEAVTEQISHKQTEQTMISNHFQTDKSQEIQNNQLNNLASKDNFTSPVIVDNRRTKTNQEALEQDSDDQIICSVWCSAPKQEQIKSNKSRLINKSAAHEGQFSVSEHGNMTRVKKLRGQGFLSPAQNFIYSEPLPIGEVSFFSAKKIQVRDNFFVGIGSSSIFGLNNSFRHRDCLAYSSNGYIWSCGDSVKVPMQELQQLLIQQIEVKVDRIRNNVIFAANGSQIVRSNIPVHLVNKELFTTIILFNKDDTIDISTLSHP